MKKKYVAPKSELFALQLNENIAASGGDELTGSMTIRFTQAADGCRGLYSGVEGAINMLGENNSVFQHFIYISTQSQGNPSSPYFTAAGICVS